MKELELKFHGICYKNYSKLDGYVRQRLRVNFSCRGKKHGGQAQGKLLSVKYNNQFFIKDMKLVCGRYLHNLVYYPEMTIEEFIEKGKLKTRPSVYDTNKTSFFKYAYAK